MVWGTRPFLGGRLEPHLSHTCIWAPSKYLADSFHVVFLVVWSCFWQRDREWEGSLLPTATERKNYNQPCQTSLAFLFHKPKSVQERKYQFSNLSIPFSLFATSLRKILLSCHNSVGLSLKEKGQHERKIGVRNLVCLRMDPGRPSEPNWQSGWKIWTFTFCVMK